MKPHFKALLILIAIFAFCVSATAQTTETSSPQTVTPTALSNAQREVDKAANEVLRETDALRLELRMRRLIDEAKASRALIAKQRQELSAADAQLKAEKENSASLEVTREKLANEADHLLKATYELRGAFETEREAKGVVLKRNEELKRKVGFWRKVAIISAAAGGSIIAGTVLLK